MAELKTKATGASVDAFLQGIKGEEESRTDKGCLYINELDSVDLKVLSELIKKSIQMAKAAGR